MMIKDLLKKARIEKGLTQRELAKLLKKNFQVYQRWETGLYKPNLNNLKLLSEVLEIDFNELLNAYYEYE
jgi:transcriptional regulator with XRE-family HTH domain